MEADLRQDRKQSFFNSRSLCICCAIIQRDLGQNHPADNRSLFVSLLYLDFEMKSYLAGEMRPGVARKVVAKEIEV